MQSSKQEPVMNHVSLKHPRWKVRLSCLLLLPIASPADELLASVGLDVGTRFHDDQYGTYYAVDLPYNATDTDFFIAAFMKPAGSGQFFRTEDVPSDGTAYPLVSFGGFETTRMNEVIYPALIRVVPELASARTLHIKMYIANQRFERSIPYYPDKNYEYPLNMLSWSRRQADDEFRPTYEFNGQAGMGRGQVLATVTQAKLARKPLQQGDTHESVLAAEQAAKAQKKAHVKSLFDEHEKLAFQRRIADRVRVASTLLDSRRDGFVYRNSNYWSQFQEFDVPRAVFEGEFGFIEDPVAFSSYYLEYVEAFYENCERFMQGPRVEYKSKWGTEDALGFRSVDGNYRVEMETRFEPHYLRHVRIRDYGGLIELLINAGKIIKEGGRDAGLRILAQVTRDGTLPLVHSRQMNYFVKSAGCGSASVKQMGDNLIAASAGLRPVQFTGKPYSTSVIQDPVVDADIERYQQLDLRRRARVAVEGPNGWPYLDEEVKPYQSYVFADEELKKSSQAYWRLDRQLNEDGRPILFCYYGPRGFRDNGDVSMVQWFFWYRETPPQLDELLETDKDGTAIARGLRHVVDKCPATSNAARALAMSPRR